MCSSLYVVHARILTHGSFVSAVDTSPNAETVNHQGRVTAVTLPSHAITATAEQRLRMYFPHIIYYAKSVFFFSHTILAAAIF